MNQHLKNNLSLPLEQRKTTFQVEAEQRYADKMAMLANIHADIASLKEKDNPAE